MKRKLLGLLACLAMVLTLCSLQFVEARRTQSGRVHQHQTARAYEADGCDGLQLCSHLPLVVIDTRNQELPGKNTGALDRYGESVHTMAEDGTTTARVDVSVIDQKTQNNHLWDQPAFSTEAEMRIRGHASRSFVKAPYLLKFVKEDGSKRNIQVMGMDAHNEWVLHGPYLDKSLIRNYLFYNLAGDMMDYAPNVRYCEVVLNGEYRGLYLMVESITNGEDGRLHLKKSIKNTVATSYLLRMDRPTERDDQKVGNIDSYLERIHTATNMDISIEYPGGDTLSAEMAKQINLEYSAFERSLYTYDYDDPAYGYWRWIDVDEFVDYYILNEFCKNEDAGRYSTYCYKNLQEKYKLCVWDFNNACDNFPDDVSTPEGFVQTQIFWFSMLLKEDNFNQRVRDRYRELRKTLLSDQAIDAYIDDTLAWLGSAIDRNSQRWEAYIAGFQLIPWERNVHSQAEAVEQLRTWLLERAAWMDEHIEELQRYCHPSWNHAFDY